MRTKELNNEREIYSGDRVVRSGDILGEYMFMKPVFYKQMIVGEIYGDSYHSTNSGYDIVKFLGFSDVDDENGPVFSNIQQAMKTYRVTSLSSLNLATDGKVRMWIQDYEDGPGDKGGWYYVYKGHWARGSGAERLRFWEVQSAR